MGASGAPSPEAFPSADPRVAPAAPVLAPEPRSAVRATAQRTGVAVSASGGGGGRKALVAALVLVVLGGGGTAAYFLVPGLRDAVGKQVGGAGGKTPATPQTQAQVPLPPAVEAVLPRWQLMFVDAHDGDSKQLVEQGQVLLAKDQRLAYSQALESFQRALLLDPRSDAAIGGYVQALALGRGTMMDEGAYQEARLLIEAAEGRSPGDLSLLVAHANLLLAHSDAPDSLEKARKFAETVLAAKAGTAAQKAEAHLVLGRTFLTSSRELANKHFDSALAIASDLQRVHYYRALADENAGDYGLAVDRLRKRLAQDPDHWETRGTLARIFLEVGDVEQARALYDSRLKSKPGDFQALLALAVMRYQTESAVSGGLGALRGMLRNRDKYDPQDTAELLLHLATAERLANNLDASTKAANEALQLVKDNPAAHLQLFLVALARKDAPGAATHLAAVKGRMGEPVVEKLLEGRLRLLERKPAEAFALFQEAIQEDPRYTDGVLLAGIAAAQEGRREDAIRVLAQALQADPLRLAPRPVLTSFFLRPGELLMGLEGSLVAMSRGEDDLLPNLYEGLLRFHQGDPASAEKLFKKVADVDPSNAPSFSYRTLIALNRKDLNSAKAHAARAVAGGRQVAIAHLVQGMVLAETKQVEPAKRELREAVTLAPKLYAAEVKLDELEAPISPEPVRERLVRLLSLDPSYLPAKRVLYLLDKRG